MKTQLKQIAKELKEIKPKFRKQQSRIEKENMSSRLSDEDKQFFRNHWDLDGKIKSLKFQFRHRHIANCLLKGRKYEEVEPVVREGNEPNWNFIRSIQNDYFC